MDKAESKLQKFFHSGMYIYIPSIVRTDSQNPLKVGDAVVISVDGKKMTIERKEAGASMIVERWKPLAKALKLYKQGQKVNT